MLRGTDVIDAIKLFQTVDERSYILLGYARQDYGYSVARCSGSIQKAFDLCRPNFESVFHQLGRQTAALSLDNKRATLISGTIRLFQRFDASENE